MSSLITPRVITILLLLLGGVAATATSAVQPPQTLVENTAERMRVALQTNRELLRAEPTRLYGLVNQIIIPNFDFELISRWVLGRYWREATLEQRNQFTAEFRTLLVRSYAGTLLEYADDPLTFPPSPKPAEDAKEATVLSELVSKSGNPTRITYSLRLGNDGWKIYDVAVDGVSLVINYRSTFANQIRDSGMDSVIRDLRERNTKSTR
jgi:phospholipid transport system substrate-binding protein